MYGMPAANAYAGYGFGGYGGFGGDATGAAGAAGVIGQPGAGMDPSAVAGMGAGGLSPGMPNAAAAWGTGDQAQQAYYQQYWGSE